MTDDDLRALFQAEPDPPNPLTGAQLRGRALDRRLEGRLQPFALVAAAILLSGSLIALAIWTAPDRGLRTRGVADYGDVTLSWVVEGADAPRVGATELHAGERVIFSLGATAPGFLCVLEERAQGWARIIPESGAWAVQPGEHTPRIGEQLAAFVTDEGPGARRYRAALDRDDPTCASPDATATTTLRWIE